MPKQPVGGLLWRFEPKGGIFIFTSYPVTYWTRANELICKKLRKKKEKKIQTQPKQMFDFFQIF